MIVPMKRAFIFLQQRYIKDSLNRIQQFGALHVDEQRSDSEELTRLRTELEDVKTILARLKLLAPKQTYHAVSSYDAPKVRQLCKEFSALVSEEQQNHEHIDNLRQQIIEWSGWGEFDPKLIRELRDNGIYIYLFNLNLQQVAYVVESGAEHFVINYDGDQSLVALIDSGRLTTEQKTEIFGKLPNELELLEFSEKELHAQIEVLEQRNLQVEEILRQRLFEQNALFVYSEDLADNVEFQKAYNSLEDIDDGIYMLSGYVPADNINDLKLLAKNYSFGLVLRDVEQEQGDAAPTQLKQNFISRLINPVLSFLEVTPAYHEPDISFSFFSFFTVFVAMIMGDAVYGLFIILLGLFTHLSTKKCNTFVQMLYVLGIATFIWGSASGSWFGAERLASMELFKHYSIWQLAVYPELLDKSPKEQQNFIMWLCFTLGAVHLTIAHLWRMTRELRQGQLKAWSNLGMVAMINGLYWVLLWMVRINQVIPTFAITSLLGGLFLIICFGRQDRSIGFFSGVLRGVSGLFTTFLDTVGLFGDIMSYIRLFAVGIASFSIASSFNGMGIGVMSIDGGSFDFLLLIAGILILTIGHVINFVLGCLSVIVHAVRLNMLEFSNHIGLEWSGYKYQPLFKRRLK